MFLLYTFTSFAKVCKRENTKKQNETRGRPKTGLGLGGGIGCHPRGSLDTFKISRLYQYV